MPKSFVFHFGYASAMAACGERCAAKVSTLVSLSISSSLRAALPTADSMMQTNDTPNPHDASLGSPTFASVLSLSLEPLAMPSTDARTEPAKPSKTPLNLQESATDAGGPAAQLPERTVRQNPAGTATFLPRRNQQKFRKMFRM